MKLNCFEAKTVREFEVNQCNHLQASDTNGIEHNNMKAGSWKESTNFVQLNKPLLPRVLCGKLQFQNVPKSNLAKAQR